MAIDFEASGDKLTTAAFTVPSATTYTAWVKNPEFTVGGPRILENATPTTRFFFSSVGDLIFQRLFTGTGQWEAKAADINTALGSTIDWTDWHHVAVTHTGVSSASPVFYVDGIVVPTTLTTSASGSINTTSSVMTIGNRPANGRELGTGAWIGIYSAALTQAQIQETMDAGYVLANLFSVWSLEVDGTTFPDLSGNGRTASKISAPVFVAGPDLQAGPNNTTVLETFDRADAELNTGNWSEDTMGFSNDGLHIVGNAAASSTAFDERSYWDTATIGPGVEVFARVNALPANTERFGLSYRVQAPVTAGVDGYEMFVTNNAGTYGWTLFSISNQTYTQIGSATQAIAVGDWIGASAESTTHKLLHRPAGGSWTQVGSDITNSVVTVAGYVGINVKGTSGRLDQFGAGELGVVPPTGVSAVTPAITGDAALTSWVNLSAEATITVTTAVEGDIIVTTESAHVTADAGTIGFTEGNSLIGAGLVTVDAAAPSLAFVYSFSAALATAGADTIGTSGASNAPVGRNKHAAQLGQPGVGDLIRGSLGTPGSTE